MFFSSENMHTDFYHNLDIFPKLQVDIKIYMLILMSYTAHEKIKAVRITRYCSLISNSYDLWCTIFMRI